jgi:hypothetical protein
MGHRRSVDFDETPEELAALALAAGHDSVNAWVRAMCGCRVLFHGGKRVVVSVAYEQSTDNRNPRG